MDEKKDVFIKKKLQGDKLISKKADEIFKNFFEGRIDMENETKKHIKDKITKYNKWIAAAACLVVILGGANVYAASNGYKNLFFMIKYLVTGDETIIEGKDEILTDRVYTISYNQITLTEHLKMQIRELQIENGEAKLMLFVNEDSALIDMREYNKEIVPLQYTVYDADNNELCNQKSSSEGNEYMYYEELLLNNYKNDTTVLKLKIDKNNGELLANITINLEDRTIEVEGEEESLKKISEVELREFLGYATNLWDNYGLTEEEALIDTALSMGTNYGWLSSETDEGYYKVEDVEKVVNSFSDKSVKDYNGEYFESSGNDYDVLTDIAAYARVTQNNTDYFVSNLVRETGKLGHCLDITDISYCAGIYTVTFTYVDSLMQNNVDEDYIYQNTVTFKLNENSEYSKFKISSYGETVKVYENSDETNTQITDDSSLQGVSEKDIVKGYFEGKWEHENGDKMLVIKDDMTFAIQRNSETIEKGTFTVKYDKEDYLYHIILNYSNGDVVDFYLIQGSCDWLWSDDTTDRYIDYEQNRVLEQESESDFVDERPLSKISNEELKNWLVYITNIVDDDGFFTEEEEFIDVAILMGKDNGWLSGDEYKVEDVERIVNSISEKSVKNYSGTIYESQSGSIPEGINKYAKITKGNTEYFVQSYSWEPKSTILTDIELQHISYSEGIYTVTYIYGGERTVEEWPYYETKVTFKLDENNGYSKFKLISYENPEKLAG